MRDIRLVVPREYVIAVFLGSHRAVNLGVSRLAGRN